MSVHDLKILPEYFAPVANGDKLFEVRKNDRGFKVGDRLILREWQAQPKTYTGGEIEAVVTYVLDNEQYLQPGYVVLGIEVWETVWE
ncbi:ASCH/PUA domain-containing protein [Saccharibacillus brassicae]|uniref:DUF3850 domain-containing protein n=1 Tax=Saccharibacillus brassicae TaxID=2583377 RepID=A0A4Y6V279_SACBS|nr:ASCH/PUA domain-containing protein [Saccharibacillus brassicae]QDH23474.1 DUF3850 domain-containing protein [Saccharibacillus brassicae]